MMRLQRLLTIAITPALMLSAHVLAFADAPAKVTRSSDACITRDSAASAPSMRHAAERIDEVARIRVAQGADGHEIYQLMQVQFLYERLAYQLDGNAETATSSDQIYRDKRFVRAMLSGMLGGDAPFGQKKPFDPKATKVLNELLEDANCADLASLDSGR